MTTVSPMSNKITTTVVGAFLLVAVLAGCGSEAKDKVAEIKDEGVKTAACKAIDAVDSKVSSIEGSSPEELKKIQEQVDSLNTALDKVSDKVPESVQTKIDDASKKLEDAANTAESDADAAKEKAKSAADDLTSSLDEASTKIGC